MQALDVKNSQLTDQTEIDIPQYRAAHRNESIPQYLSVFEADHP